MRIILPEVKTRKCSVCKKECSKYDAFVNDVCGDCFLAPSKKSDCEKQYYPLSNGLLVEVAI